MFIFTWPVHLWRYSVLLHSVNSVELIVTTVTCQP